jgi:hypothetical protein
MGSTEATTSSKKATKKITLALRALVIDWGQASVLLLFAICYCMTPFFSKCSVARALDDRRGRRRLAPLNHFAHDEN